MYAYFPPVATPANIKQIVVIEKGDVPKKVIERARKIAATCRRGGMEIFWVMFEHNPTVVHDMLEHKLYEAMTSTP